MDAGNLLKPALARGELRTIGATTLDEYRKHIEKDAALERRFQPTYVGQPSVEDTIAILRGLKPRYETHHGVRITDSAIVAAATLSDRYITDRFLPDKAIDLIDEAASRLRIENESMPAELDEIRRRMMQLQIEHGGPPQGEGRRLPPAAPEGRARIGRAAGAQQRPDRPLGGREGVRWTRSRTSRPSATACRPSSSRRSARATGRPPPASSTARCATWSAASPRPRTASPRSARTARPWSRTR